MRICFGKSVLKGIAIGKIRLYHKKEYAPAPRTIDDADAEIKRFEAAKTMAVMQLDTFYWKALDEAGKEQAMIFEIHKMLLDDQGYLDRVSGMIRNEKVSAEFALYRTGEYYSSMFERMDDEYMRSRSIDIRDITKMLIKILSGTADESEIFNEPVIVLADDLTPSETIQMDKSLILAFVTRGGSIHSHTAILARSMNIPALVDTDILLSEQYHGTKAVVDGIDGCIYIEPDLETLQRMRQKKSELDEERANLNCLVGEENVTTDGRRIDVFANISSGHDLQAVLDNDAGGIGLFRTEFLYLEREAMPTEEEQFEVYRDVLLAMGQKMVVIRTLDIGADKQSAYLNFPKEENPAMGFRGIRICLDREDVFKTQLRAIYRASVYGKAAIMFPMITSVWEVKRIKQIIENVKKELSAEGIPYSFVELGAMIETPAAAMISDHLAKEVDFFSIGTNDLTQYLLAVDRQNPGIDKYYDARHPALLAMISMTVENAHKNGIRVGICGELAGETDMTETFIDMGVDELSVSPGAVLDLRRVIRSI